MSDDLDRVLEVARAAPAVNSKSSAYRWMMAHHDKILSEVGDDDFPGWAGFAIGLASLGVKDRKGVTYRGDFLRKTWWKVKRDHAALLRLGIQPETVVRPPAPPRRPAAPPEAPTLPPDVVPVQRVKPARERPEPATATSASDSKIEEALKRMSASTPWLPKHPS